MLRCILVPCLAAGVLQAQGLTGTYRLVKDSDGRAPKAKATITLMLAAGGRLSLKAVQPGEVVEDRGTWKVSGDRITLRLVDMEKAATNAAYSFDGNTLVLPLRMMSDDPGTSTWMREGAVEVRREEGLSALLARTLAESQRMDNAVARAKVDRLAALALPDVKGGLAEAYYAQACLFFLKHYFHEAWYGFAKAASLAPTNAVYLNNLGMVLLELKRTDDALPLLQWVTSGFPKLDSPFGNLGAAWLLKEQPEKALAAFARAKALSPETGLYLYGYGKALAALGRTDEAQRNFDAAFAAGYAGSGREGQPGGTGAAQAKGAKPGPRPASRPPRPNPSTKKDKPFPPEWVGHYEAKYVRARSGEDAKEASTQFGKGMTGTLINLQTLACAKAFSMDISSTGQVQGRGQVMYVYQGKAMNPAMGLLGGPMASALAGGFATNLKDGFQLRDWTFRGTVDSDGNVEIEGLPTEELPLLNTGKWQKIKPWSPLPPDGPGAAMRGPFHMTLATGAKTGPAIHVDQWLELGDTLIRRVHYEAHIVKSDTPLTPECRYVEPKEAPCPASEYLKTKVSLTPKEGVTIEASRTYTKQGGEVQAQEETATKVGTDAVNVETSGKISAEGSKGMFTGSMEFNPTDGSYAVSVGIGVDTASVIKERTGKESPASLSQKMELVYDSKCGWGIKGTMGAKVGKVGAAVEGCVYFNKGM